MNIWHKVAKYSCGNSKRPHPVCHDVKNAQVEVLPELTQDPAPPAPPLSSGPRLGLRIGRARTHTWGSHASSCRQQRFECQCQQSLDQHEEAEDLKGPAEAQRFNHLVEENREAHGEEAGTGRHHAVGQAQTLAEVVAKNDQRGLEGEGGATAKQYAICEIAKAQRAAIEKKRLLFGYYLTICFTVTLIHVYTDYTSKRLAVMLDTCLLIFYYFRFAFFPSTIAAQQFALR